MRRCDFSLCIYQRAGTCTLSKIYINSMGFCDEAVLVELPEEELLVYKSELISKIDFHNEDNN